MNQNKIRSEDGWFSQLDNISQDSFKLFGRSELFTNLSASYYIGFLPGILQGMCIFVIVFSTLLISSVMQLIFLCANQGLLRVTLCHYISRKGYLEPIRRFLKGRLEILHSRSFPHNYHNNKLLKTQLHLRWTPRSLTY